MGMALWRALGVGRALKVLRGGEGFGQGFGRREQTHVNATSDTMAGRVGVGEGRGRKV